MGSMYSKLIGTATLGSENIKRLCDFDETDPYYFVVKENGKVLAEGELFSVKLKLDESYLYKKVKSFSRDRSIMVTTLEY